MRPVTAYILIGLIVAILVVLAFDISIEVPCGTAISEACGTLMTP